MFSFSIYLYIPKKNVRFIQAKTTLYIYIQDHILHQTSHNGSRVVDTQHIFICKLIIVKTAICKLHIIRSNWRIYLKQDYND